MQDEKAWHFGPEISDDFCLIFVNFMTLDKCFEIL